MGIHVLRRTMLYVLLAACGGGGKKTTTKPVGDTHDVARKPAPPPETEEDRQKKRLAAAHAIVPEGSKCLPAALKEDGAPRLDLAAVGKDAVVCAIDGDKSRLLGAVACWKVDLSSGALAYQDPAPLPGHDVDVMMDDHCARGLCMPNGTKLAPVAHMSWNLDGSKVAVLTGDDVHIFDAASKAHASTFSVRGDKGVTGDPDAVYFVGDVIFVEATEGPFSGIWQFKSDGTAVGPLAGIGKDDKPVSTYHGSFSVLDPNHVGVAERGFTTMTTFEIDSGKRAKAVRKIPKVACKPDELETYWKDGDKVSDKCKGSATSAFGTLIGATAVMGSKSLLVMLRDERLGELAVMDPKSLAEKKAIKMPWCTGDEGGKAAEAAPAAPKDADDKKTRGATKKGAKTGDPDEGGE